MEDMTGRWAWRGSSRSEADDPAPATLTGTVPGGTAAAGEGDDRPVGAAELDGVTADRPGGTGERRGRAGELQDGPGEAPSGTAGDRRDPADQPPPRESREPPVPAFLQRAAAWSWRLIVVGLLLY